MKKIILGLLAYALLFSTAVEAQTRTRDIFKRNDDSQKNEVRKRIQEKLKNELEEARRGNLNSKKLDFRRSGNPLIKPMKGYVLYPINFGTEEFYYSNSFTYNRDSSARITQEDLKDTVSDVVTARNINLYNTNGQLVSKTQYYYDGIDFIPSSKDSYSYHAVYTSFETYRGYYTYNTVTEAWQVLSAYRGTITISSGKITELKRERFSNNVWEPEEINTFEYNGNNRLAIVINEYYWNGNLDAKWRDEYSYDANGVLIALNMPQWNEDSTAWVDSYKIENITFDNYEDDDIGYFILYTKDVFEDAKLTSYTGFYWDEDSEEWIPDEKFDATHVTNGYTGVYSEWNDVDEEFEPISREVITRTSTEEISVYQDYDNGVWVDEYRYTRFLNYEGVISGYKNEDWDVVNEEWEVQYWEQTFSNFGLDGEILDETNKIWFSDSLSLATQNKLVYTEWMDFEDENISVTNINGKPFYTVYPNPANRVVNIRFDEVNGGNKHVVVRDISGRIVSSISSYNDIIEFSVAELKTGIYFVEVSDGQKSTISKLLKN